MKRLGLFLVVIVMAFAMVGCVKNKDADPVGSWVLSFDFECDGGAGSALWFISSGGTYIDDFGDGGTWSVDNSDITLRYDSGNVFSGEVDGDSMVGSFTQAGSGRRGCWAAQRVSRTP